MAIGNAITPRFETLWTKGHNAAAIDCRITGLATAARPKTSQFGKTIAARRLLLALAQASALLIDRLAKDDKKAWPAQEHLRPGRERKPGSMSLISPGRPLHHYPLLAAALGLGLALLSAAACPLSPAQAAQEVLSSKSGLVPASSRLRQGTERRAAQTPNRRANRRRLLLDKMTKAITPVVKVLVADLCTELRKHRPNASDAFMISAYLANPTSEDTSGACHDIQARHAAQTGMRLVSHERRIIGDDGESDRPEILVTLRFSLDAWAGQLAQSTGSATAPVLEIEMRSSRSGFMRGALLHLSEADLPELEAAHAEFQTYWIDHLLSIAPPMTSQHIARRAP